MNSKSVEKLRTLMIGGIILFNASKCSNAFEINLIIIKKIMNFFTFLKTFHWFMDILKPLKDRTQEKT